jgi:hypothetical protein
LQVILPLLLGFSISALLDGGLSANVLFYTAYLALFLGFVPTSVGQKAAYILVFPLLPVSAYCLLASASDLTLNFGFNVAFQSGQITPFGILMTYGPFFIVSLCALLAHVAVLAFLKMDDPTRPRR